MGDAALVDTFKLYVRLPVKIEGESQIKDLHPDIVKVNLPRQKSRRWCIVEFASNETLVGARALLKSKKIDGKSIIVGAFKQSDKKLRPSRKARQSKINKNNKIKAESMLDLLKVEKE